MDSNDTHKVLISKIENIDSYEHIYKLFNLSIGLSSEECMFEYIAFHDISNIRGTIFSDNWRSLKENFRAYLINRHINSNNKYAKYRYNAILAMYFGNNVIEAYGENVLLLQVAIQNQLHYYTLKQLLYSIISIYNLANKKKISIPQDKNLYCILSSILKNKNISVNNRRLILSYISSEECPSLKLSAINDLIASCTEILNSSEHSSVARQHLIKDCITICNRLMETEKEEYADKLKEFWELYGDNEYNFLVKEDGENLMVPHINSHKLEGIIDAYKISGNMDKIKKAEQEFIYWKNKQVFLAISVKLFEENDIKEINRRLNIARRIRTDLLLGGIASNCFGILPTNEQLVSLPRQYEFRDSFQTVNIDINGNGHPIPEEELDEYLKFQSYGLYVIPTITHFTQLILDRITEKTFSFSELKSILKKETILGYRYENYSGNSQSMFDIINEPLKCLFKQLTKISKHKPIDFSYPLDTLGIKIERILRDVLMINGEPIRAKTPQGKSRLFLLDDILKSDFIKRVYTLDDINFIAYTLTDKGLNIRNDAAHGFYDDRYYKTKSGLISCMCLLMCIIRIAVNYNPKSV